MAHNLHSSFFQSALAPNPWTDNQLLPKSESWWEDELAEKREILELFWQERVVKLNPKSIAEFKAYILFSHFPKLLSWEKQIDKLFSDAVSQTISFEDFFNTLKSLSLGQIRGMGHAEKLIELSLKKMKDSVPEITANDFANIQRYLMEKSISASIALGSAEKTLLAPNFAGNKNMCFSIHSIAKVFTGMLALILVRKGLIPETVLNSAPILDSAVEKTLPLQISEQLKKVTLHQLMTHKAGLGNYLDGYMAAIAQGKIPNTKTPEGFLPFAEKEVYPIGELKYSNLGILLVGLAVQCACGCGYNELLKEHIIDKVGMPSFSLWKPENAKVNSADPIAPHMAGSPAGGFWMTAEDLAKFGQWIYSQVKADPQLEILMQKYGQEFYNSEVRVVAHGGNIPSSSAFLSVSLQTGAVIATLSNQPNMALDLHATILEKLFANQQKVAEEESFNKSVKSGQKTIN